MACEKCTHAQELNVGRPVARSGPIAEVEQSVDVPHERVAKDDVVTLVVDFLRLEGVHAHRLVCAIFEVSNRVNAR